jgi:DNA repair exonuclease SbcCD ATPase subunit
MSESEFKKALNDGLIDKYIGEGTIAIRNFKPRAQAAPVVETPAVEAPVAPVVEAKTEAPVQTEKTEEQIANDISLNTERRIREIRNESNEEFPILQYDGNNEKVKAEVDYHNNKTSRVNKDGSWSNLYANKIIQKLIFSVGNKSTRTISTALRNAGFFIPASNDLGSSTKSSGGLSLYLSDSSEFIADEYSSLDDKVKATEILTKLANKLGIEVATLETESKRPVEVIKTETPKAEKTEAPVAEPTLSKKDQEELDFVSREIEATESAIVDAEEQIEIEKGNFKEEKERIQKEKAKVRASKMSKDEKADKLEELDAELSDIKDDHDDLIEQYRDDIKQEKSDLKRYNNRRVKLQQKAPAQPKVETKTEPTQAKEPEAEYQKEEPTEQPKTQEDYIKAAKESNGDYAIVLGRTGNQVVYKKNRRTGRWQGLTGKGEFVDVNDEMNRKANDAVNYTRKDKKVVMMSTVKNGITSTDEFVYDYNTNEWKKKSEDGYLYGIGPELAAKAEQRFLIDNPKRAPKTKEEIKQRISDIIDGAKADENIAMSSLIPIPPKYWNKILDLAKEAMFKGVDFSFAINDAAKKVFREAVKNKEITKDKSTEYIDAINDNIYNDDIPELTAIKKELTSDLAKEIASKGFANMKPKETFELAEKAIKSGDIDPEVLAKDIQNNPRPITDFETAILMYAKTSASTELKELYDKSKGLDKNSEAYKSINAKIQLLNDKILMYDVSGLMGGSLNASALSIRRYVMNAEYDLILPQIEKIYADNDQEMPEGLAQKIKDALKELRRLNREIEKLKADSDALKEDEAVKNIAEAAKKPSKGKADANKNSVSNDGKITVSQESIRNAVINGATEIEQVVDAVRDEVLAKFPDATDRQIRDAISNYGKEVKKSADEITQEINRIKGVGRMISQLEDIQKQLASGKGKFLNNKLKGPAKRMLTQRQAELKRAIKQAMADIPVTDQQFEDFKKYKLDAYKKRLADRTAELQERIKNKDFVPKKQTRVFELDEEAKRLEEEKRKIVDEFEYEKTKAELSSEGWFKRGGRVILDVLNLPRGLTASIDVSAPLRQGIVLLSTQNPKDSIRQIGKMLSFFAKPGSYEEWLNGVKASKEYSLFKEADLFIAEQSPKLEAKEELFANNLANKIPIIGDKLIPGTDKKGLQAYKRSEYAYAGFLNMMRAETFMQGAKALREQGYTMENSPQVYKDWATYVNSATGRGKLNLGNQKLAVALSTTFFSPSLIKARLEILGLSWGYYTKLSPAVRAMAVKRTLSFMGMMSTFLGLTALMLSLNDDDDEDKNRVELDPRSSDFGKIITKDTRIDITGGTAIYYRTLAQFFAQAKKNMATKQIEELGQKYGDKTSMDVAEQFFVNKLTPFASAVYKEYGKTEYEKQKDELEQASKDNVFNRAGVPLIVQKLIVPMWMNDAEEIVKSNGPVLGPLLVGGSLFGAGVQVMKPKFKASKSSNSMNFDFNDSEGFGNFNDAGGLGDFKEQKGIGDFN